MFYEISVVKVGVVIFDYKKKTLIEYSFTNTSIVAIKSSEAIMSGSEGTSESQASMPKYLTAEFKDGQLQIVEVTPFDKERVDSAILSEENSESTDSQPKYMQVNTSKGLMQLDLLNLTLVRCEDGEESYQMMATAESADGDIGDGGTVTCVLQTSDNDTEDHENQEYVMVDSENGHTPLVFLQSSLQDVDNQKEEQKKMPSPAEILEKARALQKAKALLYKQSPRKCGRKRKGDLPPPHELLASPNFKLYLYSCKLCSYKCNAVKDMSAHKAAEHGSSGRSRSSASGGASGARGATLQCARCPYRAGTHTQLMRHVQDIHLKDSESVHLNTEEVEAADILVCGACGYESSSKTVFRIHIEDEHGASTC